MKRERLFKAMKIGLMRSEEFGLLRGIMMLGDTIFTEDMPTACTNGRSQWFNLNFLFEVVANPKGRAFIIAHEPMHMAGRHLTIYASLHKIDPQLTNAACDYWINDRLLTADPHGKLVEMPRGHDGKVIGLHDPKYHGWTIKRIFYQLVQDKKDEKGSGGAGEGEGEGGGGFDEHDWEGAAELSDEEQTKLGDDVKQAIRQGIHASKKVGAGGLKDVLGLGELVKPQINWRQQLRIFMNSTCQRKERSTWRRPNRRYLHQDIIMPTLEGNSIREIVFARDTSGSMSWNNRLEKVTSEMSSIATSMKIDKIHLIDWDGAVERHEIYTSEQLKNPHELKRIYGGGGTDPDCVTEYLKAKKIKPECIIMLTDGEIHNWGKWTAPLLWAIVNDEKITAPVGKTININ